ncbi:glycosyltransferase family 2 protein [Microbacterium sp. Se63.02b]|uniref:glycosyltransferase family 2 protein n=1 Tax=Microbacterium sp. Se63.02b TaxID=2709304 RepID=UPI001FCE9706|nr:glycosyltransferase family 2 protein [Microbacterium sp. Se63.02b]
MRTPLVTVILPAKDAGEYIGTTLETLTRQFDDASALKLVAIDDGSRDDTGMLMRQYAQRFPHAEVVRNPTARGLATARNQGLAHVEGDAFCFVDGDDWMQPRRLEVLASRLRESDADFLRTDHVRVTGMQRTLVRAPSPWRERVMPPREAILPETESTMVDYPYAWAGIFHRRLIDRGLADFPEGAVHGRGPPLDLAAAPADGVVRGGRRARAAVSAGCRHLPHPGQGQAAARLRPSDERGHRRGRARPRRVERFLPKVVWTALALSSHHLVRARRMAPRVRAEMRSGIRDMLHRLPAAEVASVLARFDGSRRRVLARILRQAGRAS